MGRSVYGSRNNSFISIKVIIAAFVALVCLSTVVACAGTSYTIKEEMRGLWQRDDDPGNFVLLGYNNIAHLNAPDPEYTFLDAHGSTDKLEYEYSSDGMEYYSMYEWKGTYDKRTAKKYNVQYIYDAHSDTLIFVDVNGLAHSYTKIVDF